MTLEKDNEFLSEEKILNIIKENLKNDYSYSQIFGSMCTPPDNFARKIASLYAETNLGDPGLFPSSVLMEKEVIQSIATILHAPETWKGTITSGGSEANLLGCWAARNWSRKIKGIKKGKLLLPKSAHVSFIKAADLLDLQIEWIPLNKSSQINIEVLSEKISKETIGVIGIAGSTGTGVCDDIKALSDLSEDHNFYLHVDAAHGGMIFPFLKPKRIFDFENKNVHSITIDSHKILGSLIPNGTIIFRSEEFSNTISKKINYLSGGPTEQLTITGTRPGSPILVTWAILKLLGKKYIKERVNKTIMTTNYLVEKLNNISQIEIAFKPTINIVGFRIKDTASDELVNKLREMNWQLSLYSDWARIVVMPHVTETLIDKFIEDVKLIIRR